MPNNFGFYTPFDPNNPFTQYNMSKDYFSNGQEVPDFQQNNMNNNGYNPLSIRAQTSEYNNFVGNNLSLGASDNFQQNNPIGTSHLSNLNITNSPSNSSFNNSFEQGGGQGVDTGAPPEEPKKNGAQKMQKAMGIAGAMKDSIIPGGINVGAMVSGVAGLVEAFGKNQGDETARKIRNARTQAVQPYSAWGTSSSFLSKHGNTIPKAQEGVTAQWTQDQSNNWYPINVNTGEYLADANNSSGYIVPNQLAPVEISRKRGQSLEDYDKEYYSNLLESETDRLFEAGQQAAYKDLFSSRNPRENARALAIDRISNQILEEFPADYSDEDRLVWLQSLTPAKREILLASGKIDASPMQRFKNVTRGGGILNPTGMGLVTPYVAPGTTPEEAMEQSRNPLNIFAPLEYTQKGTEKFLNWVDPKNAKDNKTTSYVLDPLNFPITAGLGFLGKLGKGNALKALSKFEKGEETFKFLSELKKAGGVDDMVELARKLPLDATEEVAGAVSTTKKGEKYFNALNDFNNTKTNLAQAEVDIVSKTDNLEVSSKALLEHKEKLQKSVDALQQQIDNLGVGLGNKTQRSALENTLESLKARQDKITRKLEKAVKDDTELLEKAKKEHATYSKNIIKETEDMFQLGNIAEKGIKSDELKAITKVVDEVKGKGFPSRYARSLTGNPKPLELVKKINYNSLDELESALGVKFGVTGRKANRALEKELFNNFTRSRARQLFNTTVLGGAGLYNLTPKIIGTAQDMFDPNQAKTREATQRGIDSLMNTPSYQQDSLRQYIQESLGNNANSDSAEIFDAGIPATSLEAIQQAAIDSVDTEDTTKQKYGGTFQNGGNIPLTYEQAQFYQSQNKPQKINNQTSNQPLAMYYPQGSTPYAPSEDNYKNGRYIFGWESQPNENINNKIFIDTYDQIRGGNGYGEFDKSFYPKTENMNRIYFNDWVERDNWMRENGKSYKKMINPQNNKEEYVHMVKKDKKANFGTNIKQSEETSNIQYLTPSQIEFLKSQGYQIDYL